MALTRTDSDFPHRLWAEGVILDDSGSDCSLCWPEVVDLDVAGEEEENKDGDLPPDPFGIEEEDEAAAAATTDRLSFDEGSECYQEYPVEFLPSDPFEMEASVSQGCADCVESLFWDECGLDCGEEGGALRLSACESQDESFTFVSDSTELLTQPPPSESDAGGEESFRHLVLCLSLGYMRVQELLAVEMVCRSLRYAVQNEFFLWKCIHISWPLSERLTDESLLRLTQKAQGMLQCLSLVGCLTITDDGLKRVLDSNPRLMKLSLPGCLRLTIEGLINNLSTLKAAGAIGLTQLRLGKFFKVTKEHYEKLNALLGIKQLQKAKSCKTKFYYNTVSSHNCDDERPVDIEICPICQKLKLVFDCPSDDCQGDTFEKCRACDLCIPRCIQCGRCIRDRKFMETLFLDYLCSSCWKQPIQCQDMMEEGG